MRVIVVGAGVIGLTCAVRLLEAGHEVAVLARDLPLETTSARAAALWFPYRAFPQDRVLDWSATSYREFARLAQQPETGVVMRRGTVACSSRQDDPWWASAVPHLERVGQLPEGYVDGLSFVAPIIEMPVYLEWLHGRVLELGGTVTRMALSALPPGGDLVVNCTGLGSRLLASDDSVIPVRGQVVQVAQFGLERWWLDPDGPTHVIPRSHDIVVGGTDEEGEWSRTPAPEVTEEIIARASRLVPEVASAPVVGTAVGLRPGRPSVRIERTGHVVHCYGHGGAGVTLSWGVAAEVTALSG